MRLTFALRLCWTGPMKITQQNATEQHQCSSHTACSWHGNQIRVGQSSITAGLTKKIIELFPVNLFRLVFNIYCMGLEPPVSQVRWCHWTVPWCNTFVNWDGLEVLYSLIPLISGLSLHKRYRLKGKRVSKSLIHSLSHTSFLWSTPREEIFQD